MPDIKKKAIILGAGPTGLSTALLLSQRNNISVTIYELRAAPANIGGAIGIPSNGARLLSRLDGDGKIFSALSERAPIVPKLVLHSASAGTVLGQAEWTAYAQRETGFGYMRVKRRDLVGVLFEAVGKDERITVAFGKKVVAITDEGEDDSPSAKITLTFEDGTVDTADMLIGADGIHSAARELFVDPGVKKEYTGFAATFASVRTESLSEDLRPGILAMHGVLTTQGLFAVIPCTPSGDELFWFFSRETPIPESDSADDDIQTRDGWEMRRRGEVSNFKRILREYVAEVKGHWGAVLREIITATETIQFFPVYRLPSGGKWTRGRCILLGDAAHAMSPHAGQGVSMALEDAFALSRLLEKHNSLSLGEVWERYEAVRRPRVNAITHNSEANRNIRGRTGAWGLWAKEWMLLAGLWIYGMLGLGGWGIRQGYIVYDIEKEI